MNHNSLTHHEDSGGSASRVQALGAVAANSLASENIDNKQEKLKNGIKVIIGGPPQSGKSVLFRTLLKMLPSAYPLTASPDCEGFWSHDLYGQGNGEVAEDYRSRIKGGYSPELREYFKNNINGWNGPLMLIDMGGKINPEDAPMVKDATHAIILASDLSKVADWRDFFEDNDIDVIATIHSRYHEDHDISLPQSSARMGIVGSAHHLERGEMAFDRETIQRVAHQIENLVETNHDYSRSHAELLSDPKVIHVPERYKHLPKDENTGLTSPDAIPVIYQEASKYEGESAWFDGIRCSWETMAFALAFTENNIPDIRIGAYGSFIPVKPLPDAEEADPKWWNPPRLSGKLDESPVYVVNNTASQGKNLVYPSDLDTMTIPKVLEDAVVIISGAGPNWLKASVALGYKDKVVAIAGFQPGVGSTVVWAKDKKYLGKVLPGNV